MNKEDYLQLLVNSFEKAKQSYECPPESRLEFLSLHVFDFTTYDSEMDVLLARKSVEVCQAIQGEATFNYIDNKEDYVWYICLLNMPFFAKRIDWGTSIRGVWWDFGAIELDSSGLWNKTSQVRKLRFQHDDWIEFIEAVIEFAAEEMEEK